MAGQRDKCLKVCRLSTYLSIICLSIYILNILLNERLLWSWCWFPYEPIEYYRLSPRVKVEKKAYYHPHSALSPKRNAVPFENPASHRDFSDSFKRITQVLSKEGFIFFWVAKQISSYANDSHEELASKPEIKMKLSYFSSTSLFGAYFAFGVHRYIFNQK